MADLVPVKVPADLKDEVALRLFLNLLVDTIKKQQVEINELKVKTLNN